MTSILQQTASQTAAPRGAPRNAGNLYKPNRFQWVAEARNVQAAGTRSWFPKNRQKKPCEGKRFWQNPQPSKSNGPFAPGPLWILYPFSTDRDWGSRKARMRKTIGKTKETKIFQEAPLCCLRGAQRRILGVDSRSEFPKKRLKVIGKQILFSLGAQRIHFFAISSFLLNSCFSEIHQF